MDEIDAGRLGSWLQANVDGVSTADISVEVLAGGASNLTLGVDAGEARLVVRRPPVGAFLPSANDVAREHRYLSALRDSAVPVPSVRGFCHDTAVIGAPFYVMDRLEGIVAHGPEALAHLDADQARLLSENFVDVLRDLHAVDIDAVGLGDAARRTGFLERQVRRWTDQWHRAKDGDLPVMDELASRLAAALPTSPPTTIVHGDYRLGNVMVGPVDPTRIIGVFDWEMATLGDPLADLGYTLLWWSTRDRPPINPSQQVADLPGFLAADEVVARYGSDRDVTFYIVLAAFKLAVIGEGNRARARRLGDDPGEAGTHLADWALDKLQRPR